MHRIGLVILAACGAAPPQPRIAAGMFASPSPTRYVLSRDDGTRMTVTCKPVSNSDTGRLSKVRIECDAPIGIVEGTWATSSDGLFYRAARGEPERDSLPVLSNTPGVGELDETDDAGHLLSSQTTRYDAGASCVDWNDADRILSTCFDREGIVRGAEIRKDGDRQTTTYRYVRVPR